MYAKMSAMSRPLIIATTLCIVIFALPRPSAHAAHHAKPLLKQLGRFTAADVPAMASQEQSVGPLSAKHPAPTDLPGKGLAQHPMLYVGEGYNKIFLVDHGRIAWTYSTGGGNELDDIWMLSNGNVLYTRMQYVAEIDVPPKSVPLITGVFRKLSTPS